MDTSTRTASVALFDGERVLSETTWLAGREHSTRLLVEVELALERVGADIDQLTALGVARGPGSFTGVRVALSVAKGIATGLHIPAYGVSTLDIVACAASPSDAPVMAVVEAGRGRYATGLYVNGAMAARPRLVAASELVESITESTTVIGELSPADRAALAGSSNVRLAPAAAGARRAGFLAELAWRMAQRGEPGDPGALDALYIS